MKWILHDIVWCYSKQRLSTPGGALSSLTLFPFTLSVGPLCLCTRWSGERKPLHTTDILCGALVWESVHCLLSAAGAHGSEAVQAWPHSTLLWTKSSGVLSRSSSTDGLAKAVGLIHDVAMVVLSIWNYEHQHHLHIHSHLKSLYRI